MKTLPGFRDFFPEDQALAAYIFDVWRRVARRYGFVEYNAPVLESLELYERKNSGGEILSQLYQFEDRGGRGVALRPEMTPTLARMVAARESHYRKPLKWFSIDRFFRFERQQRGRLREFYQFNADLMGDSSPQADAEMIALSIDILRELGFTQDDVVVRISDRNAWVEHLRSLGVTLESAVEEVLGIVDKLERESPESLQERLNPHGLEIHQLREFISSGGGERFDPLRKELAARGLDGFIETDPGIVRGLAYYTGVVFEVFDRAKSMRAVAGGGRYDRLISHLSDGKANLAAAGFGMGDVVLGNLIDASEVARSRRDKYLAADPTCEIFLVLADPDRRPEALGLLQQLRDAGWRADCALSPSKVGKQFQQAESLGARFAVVIGSEWPEVACKNLSSRTEQRMPKDALADWLKTAQLP